MSGKGFVVREELIFKCPKRGWRGPMVKLTCCSSRGFDLDSLSLPVILVSCNLTPSSGLLRYMRICVTHTHTHTHTHTQRHTGMHTHARNKIFSEKCPNPETRCSSDSRVCLVQTKPEFISLSLNQVWLCMPGIPELRGGGGRGMWESRFFSTT